MIVNSLYQNRTDACELLYDLSGRLNHASRWFDQQTPPEGKLESDLESDSMAAYELAVAIGLPELFQIDIESMMDIEQLSQHLLPVLEGGVIKLSSLISQLTERENKPVNSVVDHDWRQTILAGRVDAEAALIAVNSSMQVRNTGGIGSPARLNALVAALEHQIRRFDEVLELRWPDLASICLTAWPENLRFCLPKGAFRPRPWWLMKIARHNWNAHDKQEQVLDELYPNPANEQQLIDVTARYLITDPAAVPEPALAFSDYRQRKLEYLARIFEKKIESADGNSTRWIRIFLPEKQGERLHGQGWDFGCLPKDCLIRIELQLQKPEDTPQTWRLRVGSLVVDLHRAEQPVLPTFGLIISSVITGDQLQDAWDLESADFHPVMLRRIS